MKKAALIFGTVAFLIGCSAGPQVKSFIGPTGEKVNTIRCTKETTQCFQKASESCGGGSYRVISSYRNAGGLYADIMPGPVTWYTMDTVCGPSNGVMPEFPLRGSEPAMPQMPIVPPQSVTPSIQQTQCHKVGNFVNCTTF